METTHIAGAAVSVIWRHTGCLSLVTLGLQTVSNTGAQLQALTQSLTQHRSQMQSPVSRGGQL